MSIPNLRYMKVGVLLLSVVVVVILDLINLSVRKSVLYAMTVSLKVQMYMKIETESSFWKLFFFFFSTSSSSL